MTVITSECTPSYPLCLTILINTSLMIFLFGKFYIESYSKKGKININGTKGRQHAKATGEDKLNDYDVIETENDGNGKSDTNDVKNMKKIVNRKTLMNGNK